MAHLRDMENQPPAKRRRLSLVQRLWNFAGLAAKEEDPLLESAKRADEEISFKLRSLESRLQALEQGACKERASKESELGVIGNEFYSLHGKYDVLADVAKTLEERCLEQEATNSVIKVEVEQLKSNLVFVAQGQSRAYELACTVEEDVRGLRTRLVKMEEEIKLLTSIAKNDVL